MNNRGTDRHSARAWGISLSSGMAALWLASAALALGLCGMAQAQEPGAALTSEQSREALEFLSQLSAQADDNWRLLLGYSIVVESLVGQAPYFQPEQALLDLKHSLAASNVSLEALFQPPSPTGDALFDRYALAVEASMQSQAGLPLRDKTMPTLLPDAELSTWEPEFGQDVRFWELRYMCAASGAPNKQLAPGFNAASEFLVEAVRRGLASSNTLVLLEAAGNPASLAAACALLPAAELQDGADIPEAIALQQEDKARLRILDAAVAADPGWAWAYYARAMLWFDLGQQQLGLQDLRRGNAAPRGEYPRPWPMAAIQATPCVDNPPGGIAVSAAIADTLEPSYDCMFFAGRCNNHLKESLLCANLTGDLSALEDWHQFACNLVTKSGNNFTSRTLASILHGNLRNYAEGCYGGAASATQIETLQRMRGAQLAVRSIDSRPWRYTGVHYILELLDPARGRYSAKYLAYDRDLRAHSGTAAVYADLSQVHYPQLNLPECMRKYEALSAEEQQLRKEQRRAEREAEQAAMDAAAVQAE